MISQGAQAISVCSQSAWEPKHCLVLNEQEELNHPKMGNCGCRGVDRELLLPLILDHPWGSHHRTGWAGAFQNLHPDPLLSPKVLSTSVSKKSWNVKNSSHTLLPEHCLWALPAHISLKGSRKHSPLEHEALVSQANLS